MVTEWAEESKSESVGRPSQDLMGESDTPQGDGNRKWDQEVCTPPLPPPHQQHHPRCPPKPVITHSLINALLERAFLAHRWLTRSPLANFPDPTHTGMGIKNSAGS